MIFIVIQFIMSAGSCVYSPLPQSNSESDDYSEEELHTFNERLGVITRLGKQQNQSRAQIMLNSKSPDVISYKQWDDDKDLGITLTTFQTGCDHIPPFTASKNNVNNLSPARKFCFTFSIFLCIFTTVFFLWIMPCDTDSCPHDRVIVSMKKTLSHVELFGPIRVAPGVAKYKTESLVFLFRKSFTEEKNWKQSPGYGVVSVLADSQEASWWIYLDKEPSDVDCNVIDVNLDGVNDCLVVGKDSLLRAIESSSGKELWDFEGGQALALKKCNFQFPLVLPDLDGDGVRELLSVCPVDEGVSGVAPHSHNYFFMLISGRTGASIGKPAEIKNCYSVVDVTLEKDVISYKCLNWTNRESVNMLSLKDFLSNVNAATSEKWANMDRTHSRVFQHKTSPDGDTLYLDGRRFTLENKGQCPGRCSMIVKIDDEKNGRTNQTTWPLEIENSYGMIPVGLKRERFTIFVFKYWLWERNEGGQAEYLGKINASNDGEGRETVRRSNWKSFRESESLENAMFGGDMPEYPRIKRTLTRTTSGGPGAGDDGNVVKKENLTFHRIVERTVLITFNETNKQGINTSECEIVQICGHRGDCQPDARFQRQSLHIADVDNDDFQDLISYKSSFVNRRVQESTSESGAWELQSSVEVIQLESELDKVYEEKN